MRVRPDYFTTMGIRLLSGLLFTERDGTDTTPVVIVANTMAEALWPGTDRLGQRIRVAGGRDNPFRTIVGVVGMCGTTDFTCLKPCRFMCRTRRRIARALPDGGSAVGGGSSGAGTEAREEVRGINALQPVTRIRTYDGIVARLTATRRASRWSCPGSLAGTALVLAIVGLFRCRHDVVTQRQRGIDMRVASGATTARSVVWCSGWT
jgi:hypothetical protein